MADKIIDIHGRVWPGSAQQDLATIEFLHMKFADIRAQLTRIDEQLTRQRHLLEQILKLAEKFL